LIGWDSKSAQSDDRNDDRDDDRDDGDDDNASSPSKTMEDSDSDCPAPELGFKGIKINPEAILKLPYKSTIAWFNNWIADLKRAFDGDLAKFPTSY
jgi:hypothetical protein